MRQQRGREGDGAAHNSVSMTNNLLWILNLHGNPFQAEN